MEVNGKICCVHFHVLATLIDFDCSRLPLVFAELHVQMQACPAVSKTSQQLDIAV